MQARTSRTNAGTPWKAHNFSLIELRYRAQLLQSSNNLWTLPPVCFCAPGRPAEG